MSKSALLSAILFFVRPYPTRRPKPHPIRLRRGDASRHILRAGQSLLLEFNLTIPSIIQKDAAIPMDMSSIRHRAEHRSLLRYS